MKWTWQRSSPTARTDQLTAVRPAPAPAHSGARSPYRPRTLRLPRVRKVILRSPVDQIAADTLESCLRALTGGAAFGPVVYAGAVVIADEVIGERFIPTTLRERVHRHAVSAVSDHLTRLRTLSHRADAALDAARERCSHCTPVELCGRHQDVLWRWWDIRDTAAVAVVNTTIAALAVPARTTARTTRRRP